MDVVRPGRSAWIDEAVAQRFAGAEATVRQRAEERRAAAERRCEQQVQRLDQLIERANKRASAEDLTLREADRSRASCGPRSTRRRDCREREQQALVDGC